MTIKIPFEILNLAGRQTFAVKSKHFFRHKLYFWLVVKNSACKLAVGLIVMNLKHKSFC
jgi:hypothetical protein